MSGAEDDGRRARLQEEEYAFPYHYLPHVETGPGGPRSASTVRYLRWGLEYACYLQHVAALVEQLAPSSHLDVGCGDARLFHVTPSAGVRRVGVDSSTRALDFARAFNPDALFLPGLDRLPSGEGFDLVSAVEVLEHLTDEQIPAFVGALRDRVRPGGHLLVCVPSTAQPLHAKHYRHYSEALLLSQVCGAWPDLALVRVDHVCRGSRLVDAYARWTLNRFVVLELRPLRRVIWRHVWRRLRRAAPGQGRHLVGLWRAAAFPVRT